MKMTAVVDTVSKLVRHTMLAAPLALAPLASSVVMQSFGVEALQSGVAHAAEEQAKKPTKTSRIFKGCTLFVKNLSFETDDDDLYNYFAQFGDLRYARVVYQKETHAHKGTGFVCFKTPEDTTKTIDLFKTGLGEDRPNVAVKADRLRGRHHRGR